MPETLVTKLQAEGINDLQLPCLYESNYPESEPQDCNFIKKETLVN